MRYTSFFLVLGGAALVLSFRQLMKVSGVRPPALGPVSERWLFEQRRHTDER